MKSVYYAILSLFTAATISGCAGQTTDPRQGGLFSYNPKAYEKRAQDKKDNVSKIEQSTQSAKEESSKLEANKSSQAKEKAALEAKLQELSSSIASLEKNVQESKAKTGAQKKEQKRIMEEIDSMKSSFKLADEIEDPGEQTLELERLKKKRDELEKEAANLMLL